MYQFHCSILAVPPQLAPGPEVVLRGVRLPTWVGDGGGPPLFTATFPRSFEEARLGLDALPRMDTEPDGYFLLAGDAQGRRWQIDGHLFEWEGALHRMELRGQCPQGMLNGMLAVLGWPETEVVFQLVQEGATLQEADFRRWASAPAS